MRVLVDFLETLLMHVRVHVTRPVVTVLVLMLHMFVIMQEMRVHMRHITVLVLVSMRCVSHLNAPFLIASTVPSQRKYHSFT